MRKNVFAAVAVVAILLVGAAPALAAASRSSKSASGVRATLEQWVNLLLTGKEKAACAILTPHGQAAWVQDSGIKNANCVSASTDDYKYFKKYPADGASLKKYATNVPITLKGSTATVPKVSGGDRTLLYKNGLWYINS